MATVEFKFKESEEKTDIQLCANRWKLYNVLSEVDTLVRKLFNGKTYKEVYLYPMMARDEETDKEILTGYSLNEICDGDKSTAFIEVDYIVKRLSDAIADIRYILDE